MDIATLEESEHRASTAFEAFRALFCDIPEFGTNEKAHEFLAAAESDKVEMVLSTLYDWLREQFHKLQLNGNSIRFEADSGEELNQKLKRFVAIAVSGDEKSSIPSFWPVIETIRFELVYR